MELVCEEVVGDGVVLLVVVGLVVAPVVCTFAYSLNKSKEKEQGKQAYS